MGQNQSAIVSQLQVDDALVQDANYRFDRNDRQYIDNQIRGVEQHLVDNLIRGRHGTYARVSTTALAVGDVVCIYTTDIGELQVVKATSAYIAQSGSAYGIVVLPAAVGAYALIAIGGAIPASIHGLTPDPTSFKPVRVNTTTGRAQVVSSFSSGDYGIGFLSTSGYLHVVPGISGSVSGGATPGGSDGQLQAKSGTSLIGAPISTDGTNVTVTGPKVINTGDSKVTFQTIPVDIQTTNATPATLQSFSVGTTSGVVFVRGIVTASDSTATNTGAWAVDLAYKNVGGTLTQLGSGGITAYGTPSGTLALAASVTSGTVTLTATGISATTLRWTCNGFQNVAVGS